MESYIDSAGRMSVVAAVQWLGDIVIGPVGTTIAVVAVSAIGLAMLLGRVPVRRGAMVVLGCFVLFGASAIADGLLGLAGGTAPQAVPIPLQTPSYSPTIPTSQAYDPYAGASVPVRGAEANLLER